MRQLLGLHLVFLVPTFLSRVFSTHGFYLSRPSQDCKLVEHRQSFYHGIRIQGIVLAAPITCESTANVAKQRIGDIVILISSKNAKSTLSKFGSGSVVGCPSIADAASQLANKAFWFADGLIDTYIAAVPEANDQAAFARLCETDVLIALGLQDEAEILYVSKVFQARRKRTVSLRKRQCQFALDCSLSIPAMVGPYDELTPSLRARLLPWTEDATARRIFEKMTGAFNRWTTDDFCFAILIFLNQFSGSKVDWVRYSIDATWEKGVIQNAKELYNMISKCSKCIGKCVADDTCRECIGKLTKIDTRDQVASYRTIVSYESDSLRDFSMCILTKNNVFGCDAKIPTLPKVDAIATWRGKELTEPDGRALLVGHLDDPASPAGGLKTDVSWKVVFGANEAYDKFPSQNQLFYPTTRGRDMWYDPVFRVETLDGRHVWCARHYKVRPGPKPGTFRFSVLDNGVTSDEFWNIVGVADDLSWIVFHYAGAAAAVGLRYLGGLVCTADGSIPKQSEIPRIWECLNCAGIQPWELYAVDNDPSTPGAIAAGPAPLGVYRTSVLAKRTAAASS
jgi:hypothetical protein